MAVRTPVVIFAFALCAASALGAELPGWVSVEGTHGTEDVELFYRALTSWPGNPRFDAGDGSNFEANRSTEPGIEGEWAFFGVHGDPAPTSAIRRRLPKHAPYRVRVDLYCDGMSCEHLRSVLEKMPAPSVFGDPTLVQDWRKIVAEEACDPLPPENRPHHAYPRGEQRRGIEGKVVLSVFHNRCGDVRDTTIETSSGNRNLDRAARKTILRWRVKPTSGNTAGWRRETVEFRLDDPATPPPPPPIDVHW